MLSAKRQKGMTFLGYMIVLSIIGFFAVMVMKLAPIYLEYNAVVQIMDGVAQETGTEISPAMIRSTIQKRLGINNIDRVSARDFKIERGKAGTMLNIDYEARTKFMGNLWFLMVFSHSVELGGA